VAKVRVQWTMPLQFAEIVWGDGTTTHREVIELGATREFGSQAFEWRAKASGWKWARVRRVGCRGEWRVREPGLAPLSHDHV
jgi:hypothetical protein